MSALIKFEAIVDAAGLYNGCCGGYYGRLASQPTLIYRRALEKEGNELPL